MTDSEIHECLTLLRAISERPRCSAGRTMAIVVVSVAVGVLFVVMPW